MTPARAAPAPDYRLQTVPALKAAGDALWIHGWPGSASAPHLMPSHWQTSLGFRRDTGPDGRVSACELIVLGPTDTPYLYEAPAGRELIALRLHPEACARLTGFEPRPLNGEKVEPDGDMLWLDNARRLAERGASASEVGSALAAATSRRLAGFDPGHDSAAFAARMIRRTGGRVRMDRLADHLGMPERTLRRRFAQSVGVTPKRYARLVRLGALIAAADRSASPDWAELALRHGYTDQAHMSQEMLRLTGLAPSRLHRLRQGTLPA